MMKTPRSMRGLEELGRVRLSESFFLRDFLHSEIAAFHKIPNMPDDADLAIAAGSNLCQILLEPLQKTFGRLHIRSGYRSRHLNAFGNVHGLNCARNGLSAADHIWDLRDAAGFMGATACIVVPWAWDHRETSQGWQALAWWIHDHLPYGSLRFFPRLWAFNIQWHERPRRRIDSYVAPAGLLTKPGMANHDGSHADAYRGFPPLATGAPIRSLR